MLLAGYSTYYVPTTRQQFTPLSHSLPSHLSIYLSLEFILTLHTSIFQPFTKHASYS